MAKSRTYDGIYAGGFPCPACGAFRSSVVDSRRRLDSIRRRRKCDACGEKWTTLEVNARLLLKVRKIVNLLPSVKEYVDTPEAVEHGNRSFGHGEENNDEA